MNAYFWGSVAALYSASLHKQQYKKLQWKLTFTSVIDELTANIAGRRNICKAEVRFLTTRIFVVITTLLNRFIVVFIYIQSGYICYYLT